ncbi:MAG TPA: hypothetical protein VMU08_08570 [Rhizomicrobium sp.]|nr:hypothetical protein [Rhizomicrobium sp.]
MTLADIASLSSAISGIAVVASLAFLYFQVRQVGEQVKLAERSARAIIAQERVNRISGIQMQAAEEPSLADAAFKGMAGAELTPTQFNQFRAYTLARFLNSEDSYFQHKNGLLSDEAFATFERTFVAAFRQPGVRVLWKWTRTGFDPEFVAFTDRIMAREPVVPPGDDFARWKADLAAERAAGERA